MDDDYKFMMSYVCELVLDDLDYNYKVIGMDVSGDDVEWTIHQGVKKWQETGKRPSGEEIAALVAKYCPPYYPKQVNL